MRHDWLLCNRSVRYSWQFFPLSSESRNVLSGRRTFRMGLLDAAYYLGSPVGLAVAGPLLDAGGYRAVFIVVMALYAATIVYVAVRFHGERREIKNTDVRKTNVISLVAPMLLISKV